MISLLVYFLIMLIVFGLVYYIIGLIPLPHPFALIAQLVLALIFLLVLLSFVWPLIGGLPHTYPIH